MRDLLYEHWTSQGGYADPYNNNYIEYTHTSERWYFDRVSRTDTGPITGETGQSITSTSPTPPPDFILIGEFWHECIGTTRRGYKHNDSPDFLGQSFTEDIPNATECGYVPPPSCTLLIEQVSVSGTAATVDTTGAVGTLRFSLDGGTTWQSSGEFIDLVPNTYTVIVEDLAVSGCTQTATFTIEPLPPAPAVQPAFVWSQNPIFLTAQATQPYRRLRATVCIEQRHGTGTYAGRFELEQITDGSGSTTFRYDREIDALLTRETPSLGQQTPVRLIDRIRRFYVELREISPATGQPGLPIQTNVQTVLLGGLPEPMAAEVDFFGQLLPDSKMFLTWMPALTRLAPNQVAYLDFLLTNPALTTLVQHITTYDAGGAQLAHYTRTVNFAAPGTASLWRVSVRAQYNGATMRVQLKTAAGAALSEARTFEIVRDGERPRLLLFVNSLGGLDALCLRGQLTGKQTVERETAEKLRQPDLDSLDGRSALTMWRRTGREPLKVATGWLSPEEQDWLRDFFLTPAAWEVVSNRLRPIELLTKDFDFFADEPGLTSALIEYRHAYPQNHYGVYAATTFNRPAPTAGSGDSDSDNA